MHFLAFIVRVCTTNFISVSYQATKIFLFYQWLYKSDFQLTHRRIILLFSRTSVLLVPNLPEVRRVFLRAILQF